LTNAESERRALLDFLQTDQDSKANLLRRVERAEAELQLVNRSLATTEQRAQSAETALEKERLANAKHDAETALWLKKADEKGVENEYLRTQKAALESKNAALEIERKQLRGQMSALHESLGMSEPRLAQLEPEVLRLRGEKSDWQLERSRLMEELGRLRPLEQLLGDVENELASRTRNISTMMSNGSSSSSAAAAQFPSASSWTSAPELRRRSPRLYEHLRSLSQAVYQKEVENADLEASLLACKKQIEALLGQLEDANEVREREATQAQLTLGAYQVRIEQLEHATSNELPLARSALGVLDEVRRALGTSFPGGFPALIDAIQNDAAAAITSTSGGPAEDRVGGGGMVAGKDKLSGYMNAYQARKQQQQQQQVLLQQALASSSLPIPPSIQASSSKSSKKAPLPSFPSSSSSSAGAQNAKLEEGLSLLPLPEDLPDALLPELLKRVLKHNLEAVTKLKETREKQGRLEEANLELKRELNDVSRKNNLAREALAQLKEQVQEEKIESSGRDNEALSKVKRQLEHTTELAEKQLEFAMLLESKLEEAKRECKHYQLLSTEQTQREQSLKMELWNALEDLGAMPPPMDNTQLATLISLVQELFVASKFAANEEQQKGGRNIRIRIQPLPPPSSSFMSSSLPLSTPNASSYAAVSTSTPHLPSSSSSSSSKKGEADRSSPDKFYDAQEEEEVEELVIVEEEASGGNRGGGKGEGESKDIDGILHGTARHSLLEAEDKVLLGEVEEKEEEKEEDDTLAPSSSSSFSSTSSRPLRPTPQRHEAPSSQPNHHQRRLLHQQQQKQQYEESQRLQMQQQQERSASTDDPTHALQNKLRQAAQIFSSMREDT